MTDFKSGYKNIRVIPFKSAHLRGMRVQKDQIAEYEKLPSDFGNIVQITGLSYTIINNQNEIVGVYGVFPTEEDSAESWCFNSDLFAKHAIEVTKCVSAFFDEIFKDKLFSVIRGCVKLDWKAGQKWMQMLKFTDTGIEDTYDGLNFTIFERVA